MAKDHIRAALDDAEITAPRLCAESPAGALRPTQRQFHGVHCLLLRVRKLNALIELHMDIRPQQTLDVHGPFRTEFVFPAIDVGLERRSFLADLPDFGQ